MQAEDLDAKRAGLHPAKPGSKEEIRHSAEKSAHEKAPKIDDRQSIHSRAWTKPGDFEWRMRKLGPVLEDVVNSGRGWQPNSQFPHEQRGSRNGEKRSKIGVPAVIFSFSSSWRYARLPPFGRQVCGKREERAPTSWAGDQAAAWSSASEGTR